MVEDQDNDCTMHTLETKMNKASTTKRMRDCIFLIRKFKINYFLSHKIQSFMREDKLKLYFLVNVKKLTKNDQKLAIILNNVHIYI